MAVDEALLESAAECGRAALRFYTWSEPTLSLGYFQNYSERDSHLPSRECALVRRQTGGGAILHDRELTYSLALPVESPSARDASRLYEQVHIALVEVLARFGVEARFCTPPLANLSPSSSTLAGEPFLCFQRRARNDLLVDDSKVCGSAQRRRRGAILQHGSILLACSEKAPELPGIRELSGQNLSTADVIEVAAGAIGLRLGLGLIAGELTADEASAAQTLCDEKYSGNPWNQKRI